VGVNCIPPLLLPLKCLERWVSIYLAECQSSAAHALLNISSVLRMLQWQKVVPLALQLDASS
jgi:hypothetical protein